MATQLPLSLSPRKMPRARTPRTTPCAVETIRTALRDAGQDGQALRDLACFARLKKWTTALFAARWNTTPATARRALIDLHRHGVIACLQGVGRTTKGKRHGGRGADVWFLTACGARVLTAHLGPPSPVRHPDVARGKPVPTAGGLRKYKQATKQSRAQIAHDLACVRLAVHYGWLDDDAPWATRERVRYTDLAGTGRHLTPDFSTLLECPMDEKVVGYRLDRWPWYVELEGSDEESHIWEKHDTYAALAAALGRQNRRFLHRSRQLQLTIVFHFSPEQQKQRQTVISQHLAAYGRQEEGWRYWLQWVDLSTLLTADPSTGLSSLCIPVEWGKEHERYQQRRRHQDDRRR